MKGQTALLQPPFPNNTICIMEGDTVELWSQDYRVNREDEEIELRYHKEVTRKEWREEEEVTYLEVQSLLEVKSDGEEKVRVLVGDSKKMDFQYFYDIALVKVIRKNNSVEHYWPRTAAIMLPDINSNGRFK